MRTKAVYPKRMDASPDILFPFLSALESSPCLIPYESWLWLALTSLLPPKEISSEYGGWGGVKYLKIYIVRLIFLSKVPALIKHQVGSCPWSIYDGYGHAKWYVQDSREILEYFWTKCFFPSFLKYLLSTHYDLGIDLGMGETAMNKTRSLYPHEVYILVEKRDNK